MAIDGSTKRLAEEEVTTDMTPMIDVTFLLLIFFLCTLNLKSLETMLVSHLPKNQGIYSKPMPKEELIEVDIRIIKISQREVKILMGENEYQGENKFKQLYRKLLDTVESAPNKVAVSIKPGSDIELQNIIEIINITKKITKNKIYKNKLELKLDTLK